MTRSPKGIPMVMPSAPTTTPAATAGDDLPPAPAGPVRAHSPVPWLAIAVLTLSGAVAAFTFVLVAWTLFRSGRTPADDIVPVWARTAEMTLLMASAAAFAVWSRADHRWPLAGALTGAGGIAIAVALSVVAAPVASLVLMVAPFALGLVLAALVAQVTARGALVSLGLSLLGVIVPAGAIAVAVPALLAPAAQRRLDGRMTLVALATLALGNLAGWGLMAGLLLLRILSPTPM